MALSNEELSKRLTAEGVIVSNEDSKEDQLQALAITEMNGFWKLNPQVHPNYGRVKNWLMVHGKYREYLRELADEEDEKEAKAAFAKWRSKLEGHSNFEDEQLFKFFKENVAGMDEELKELEKQHETQLGQTEETIFDSKEWKASLQIYVDEMLKHMEMEEIVIIKPWLHLTDKEYQKYRTYLSWKYAAMY
jgi:hypothetical protein